jgi:F-type H+-transporting ATPase subunit b
LVVAGCVLCIHILGDDLPAAESGGNWRSAYDPIMRWVNFLILAFIIVKFGKKPLINFLQIRKEETERTIQRTEARKNEADKKIREIRKTIDESHIRYARLKEKIVEDGKKRKQEIINDARQQGQYMIETAKRKSENLVLEAKAAVKLELMDAAVALAQARLPGVVTEEDNLSWISRVLKRDIA